MWITQHSKGDYISSLRYVYPHTHRVNTSVSLTFFVTILNVISSLKYYNPLSGYSCSFFFFSHLSDYLTLIYSVSKKLKKKRKSERKNQSYRNISFFFFHTIVVSFTVVSLQKFVVLIFCRFVQNDSQR